MGQLDIFSSNPILNSCIKINSSNSSCSDINRECSHNTIISFRESILLKYPTSKLSDIISKFLTVAILLGLSAFHIACVGMVAIYLPPYQISH
jgi:hypothetical protein